MFYRGSAIYKIALPLLYLECFFRHRIDQLLSCIYRSPDHHLTLFFIRANETVGLHREKICNERLSILATSPLVPAGL